MQSKPKNCNGSNYDSFIECYIFVINTVFVGNKIVSSRRVFADSAPTFVFGNGTKKVCSVDGKPMSSILIKKSLKKKTIILHPSL